MKLKRILLYFLPALIFLLPAALGLALEGYNRHFRGWMTPFLWVAIGLILISLLFLIRRKWALGLLGLINVVYVTFFLVTRLWTLPPGPSVYYYRSWWLHSPTGRIHLVEPLGRYPPEKGPYLACHFQHENWVSMVKFQPSLCTGFDEGLRLAMFLNDHETEEGILREFQMNQFNVDRKTLIGDPVDRGALRIAYVSKSKGIRPRFEIREMYQVYEKELEGGQSRVLESISRDGKGKLRTLTESSLPNLTDKDLFAVYNQDGYLSRIPRMTTKSFAFPGKIDITGVRDYTLPERIYPGANHAED